MEPIGLPSVVDVAISWYNSLLVYEMQEASPCRSRVNLQGGKGSLEMEMQLLRHQL
jgi:tRNA threonylcarbamoyladenosine modification (KEOPS) complex  Pcc1 subunit